MMSLPTALTAMLTSSALLALIYLYLYRQEREKALLVWAAAWAVYALRLLFMFAIVRYGERHALLIGNQLASLASCVLLLWGASLWAGRTLARGWFAVFALGAVWIAATVHLDVRFFFVALPTFLLFGSVTIWTGVIILRHGRGAGLGTRLAGWTLILWGIHKYDYPFTRPVEWFAPWGYLLASIFALATGVGILLLYFEETRRTLRDSEQRLRILFDQAADAVFVCGLDGHLVKVNEQACRSTGFTEAELLRLNVTDVDAEANDPGALKEFHRTLSSLHATRIESRHRRKDGSTFPVEIIVAPQDTPDGIHVVATARDITERLETEAALRRSEAMLHRSQSIAHIGSWEYDIVSEQLVWSDEVYRIFGMEPPEVGTSYPAFLDLVHPDDREAVDTTYWESVREGHDTYEFENRIVRRDNGDVRIIHLKCEHVKAPDGSVIQSVGMVQDITDRKRAEEERDRLMSAIEQAAEVVVITDTDGTIQYANPAFERTTLYTREEAVGQNPRILKSGEQNDAFYREMWDTLLQGDVWRGRLVNMKKDGTFYTEDAVISPVRDASGRTVNYVAVKRDVTAEVEFEGRLRQSQKMEAIGTLAGGIAHDFNNILFAMGGYAELLLESLEAKAPEALPYVQEILKGGERARDLVRQILAFSRKAPSDRHPLKLGSLVKETCKMLRGAIPSTIEIRTQTPDQGDTVLGDASQLHQVITNLSTNAWQAMADRGGALTVVVAPVEVDAETGGGPGDLEPGAYVKLSVTDTGSGIAPENMDKIFDPFFTTKELGGGTGLGLSVVHGVIKEHGGAIDVVSEPGKGATFNILLPRVPETAVKTTVPKAEDDLPRGSERILVVDDEEAILVVVGRLLVSLGYHVTTRPESPDALDTFMASPGAFDLIITDLTMPGLTGRELCRRILDVRPDIPVLLCTGYGDQITWEDDQARGFRAALTKPVRRRELALTVRGLLDRAMEPKEEK